MSSSNFNLRGLSSEMMLALKQEAKRLHVSVNTLVLKMIERGLGFSQERPVYHDLDHLIGTWSNAEVEEFKSNTKFFEEIDPEMWK